MYVRMYQYLHTRSEGKFAVKPQGPSYFVLQPELLLLIPLSYDDTKKKAFTTEIHEGTSDVQMWRGVILADS